jgi:enoyl-CoA hydratase/carnithine racemase
MEFNTTKVIERSEGVGFIVLNRPERRNAISFEMRLEILKKALWEWLQGKR